MIFNAATASETWAIENLEAELLDFVGGDHLLSFALCAAYSEVPADKDSTDIHSIIVPQGLFAPTWAVHNLNFLSLIFRKAYFHCLKTFKYA